MSSIWSNVVGHNSVINDLKTLILSKRVPSLLLFSGPSGVGKKLLALGLIQALNCEKSPENSSGKGEACGKCPSCLRLQSNSSEALFHMAPQGAHIKIESAREALSFLSLKSLSSWRMVLIDEADKLNPQAANCLLKAFEEPPEKTFFSLLAPSRASVLPTIQSRAQVVRVGGLSTKDLKKIRKDLPDWRIQASQGRLDRIELLEGEEVSELRRLTCEFLSSGLRGEREAAMESVKKVGRERENIKMVHGFLREFIRDAYFSSQGLSPVIHDDLKAELFDLYERPPHQLLGLSKKVQSMAPLLAVNVDPQILLEDFIRNDLD